MTNHTRIYYSCRLRLNTNTYLGSFTLHNSSKQHAMNKMSQWNGELETPARQSFSDTQASPLSRATRGLSAQFKASQRGPRAETGGNSRTTAVLIGQVIYWFATKKKAVKLVIAPPVGCQSKENRRWCGTVNIERMHELADDAITHPRTRAGTGDTWNNMNNAAPFGYVCPDRISFKVGVFYKLLLWF
jgi:hypothetical protein